MPSVLKERVEVDGNVVGTQLLQEFRIVGEMSCIGLVNSQTWKHLIGQVL